MLSHNYGYLLSKLTLALIMVIQIDTILVAIYFSYDMLIRGFYDF